MGLGECVKPWRRPTLARREIGNAPRLGEMKIYHKATLKP